MYLWTPAGGPGDDPDEPYACYRYRKLVGHPLSNAQIDRLPIEAVAGLRTDEYEQPIVDYDTWLTLAAAFPGQFDADEPPSDQLGADDPRRGLRPPQGVLRHPQGP